MLHLSKSRLPFRLLIGCIALLLVISCDEENQIGPEEQLARDIQIIEGFLIDNNLNAQRTEEDVFYMSLTPGEGSTPLFGDTVIYHYRTMRLGNTVNYVDEKPSFGYVVANSQYTNEDGTPLQVSIGQQFNLPASTPAGVYDAFGLMQEGETAVFLLPSEKAFGRGGAAGVLPNQVVAYELSLIEVRSAF